MVGARLVAVAAAMSMVGLVAPVGSGVAQAQVEPGPRGRPPITVTIARGPNGEALHIPSPLEDRPVRMLNERGQVVATMDWSWRGPVVLWHDGAATRISPEGITAVPTDISDSGQVVGNQDAGSPLGYPTLPFSWQDGEWTTLPLPAGAFGSALAVNDAGQVVGNLTVYDSDGVEEKVKVVAWSGGQLVEAPVDIPLGAPRPAEPVDINERGQALFNVDTVGSAYLWDVGGGGVSELESVVAVAVNNRGQVVGRGRVDDDGSNAVLWEDGQLTDLGTLGGTRSEALDINERGQVVGISRTEGDVDVHGFLWEDGEMTDLGTLGGGPWSYAVDINDRGQIVGQADLPVDGAETIEARAFLWEDGEMTDLGALLEPVPGAVIRINRAHEINESGQIVGRDATYVDVTRPRVDDVVVWTLPRRR